MQYPLRLTDQLRQHLRALRRQRGLTQAQLGALVGVSQARIAEIEANPGLVNFEQVMKLLFALGATLSLQDESPAGTPALAAAERLPAPYAPSPKKPARAANTRPKTEAAAKPRPESSPKPKPKLNPQPDPKPSDRQASGKQVAPSLLPFTRAKKGAW